MAETAQATGKEISSTVDANCAVRAPLPGTVSAWVEDKAIVALAAQETQRVIDASLTLLAQGSYQERELAKLITREKLSVQLAVDGRELRPNIAWLEGSEIILNPQRFPFVKVEGGKPVAFNDTQLAEAARVIAPILAHELTHKFIRSEIEKRTDDRARILFSSAEEEVVAVAVEAGVWGRLRDKAPQPHTVEICATLWNNYALAKRGVAATRGQISATRGQISILGTDDAQLKQGMLRELASPQSCGNRKELREQIEFIGTPGYTDRIRNFFVGMMREAETQLSSLP